MASIKKIKTSNHFNNNKLSIYSKENSNNSENKEDFNKNNYIEKTFLEELLKCEICGNIFDLNNHIPIVIKCGHSFCKQCILNINTNNKLIKKNYSCPLDNTPNAFNLENCVINLRLELLIKKIFNNENNKTQKQIVYSKPDIKKVNQNTLLNSETKKNGEYGYKKFESIEKSEKKDDLNDNLNTPQIEDEINMNNKLLFEDEKIKGVMINETIDTIPLYDEKSFENVSFKEDVNELFEKKISSKTPFLTENIKKELNKNKYIANNKKKNINEDKINNNKVIKPLSKLIPNLSLTPNKNKEFKSSDEPIEENYNYTDRYNYKNDYIKKQILLENNNKNKNSNKISEINKILKISKKVKDNDDIIILNKKEEEKSNKGSYIHTQNYPSKKIILFSNVNNNTNNENVEYNYNKLNTIQNLESDEKRIKANIVLNKNANILSTQILKNTTNTIEAKNIDYEQLIKSTNKRPKKIGRNYNDNDNEAFTKNRTFNCKNEENNSLLDLLDNSNKENKNNDLNKNIKILNKSNNNSSSYSNSNSNSVYNKKKVRNENSINKKENSQENSNYHKLNSTNSKSQNLLSIENLKKIDLNKETLKNDDIKLRPTIDSKNNNFGSNSTLVLKKNKNSNIIFSSKHFNKNRKSDINLNEQKEKEELNIDEVNIRRANSFITNNKAMNKKRQIDEKRNILEDELNKIIKNNKNVKIENSKNVIKNLFEDKNYENDIDKIKINLFENNDIFIGIMDNDNIFPLKGVLYTHNGDYYNGEFSEGKKNGQGSIIYTNGTKYEGTFKNDFHDGYGKLIQSNGEIYEGEWKKGKINGKGMRIHSNGNKYIGHYINNVRNGNGHLIFVNGESYNGNFVNGKANGIGIFKFKNGNIYEGEFKDNLILGKGTLTMQNGDKYIGTFKNGLINGKGTYINNNGEKYIGNFQGNKKNGYGKLYDKNGTLIKEGIWENGIFIENE